MTNPAVLPLGLALTMIATCTAQESVATITPADLAHELLAATGDVVVIDVRGKDEFDASHIRGAHNMSAKDVTDAPDALFTNKPRLVVVVGDASKRARTLVSFLHDKGHANVRFLDGETADFEKLVRDGRPDVPGALLRRAFFCGDPKPNPLAAWATDPAELTAPTMVSPKWLHDRLGKVAVLDVRKPADFAALHVPGAVHVDLVRLRVKAGDRELHLVSDAQLAEQFGAMGLSRTTPVVLYADDKIQDPAMVALALLRLGHRSLAIMEGGILRWATERRPLVAAVVAPVPAKYEPLPGADDFSIAIDELAANVKDGATAVLDVRPPEFFRGEKSTEARPGHIPGAKNRLFSTDFVRTDDGHWLRPRAELEKEYAATGIAKNAPVTVTCRTGHTASETVFVLRYLLGYENVRWFNGSWTEWAERKDLPAATGDQ